MQQTLTSAQELIRKNRVKAEATSSLRLRKSQNRNNPAMEFAAMLRVPKMTPFCIFSSELIFFCILCVE